MQYHCYIIFSQEINMSVCGIGRKGLCFTEEETDMLCKMFKIEGGADKLKSILKKTGCSDAVCVLDAASKSGLDVKRLRDYAIKVEGPESKSALLDSFIIIRMCNQIIESYKKARKIIFAGIFTIDFMMDPPTTPYADPKNIVDKDFDQMHFVFNLDHRQGGGRHWMCMVIDKVRKQILYFDSYGEKPAQGTEEGSDGRKFRTDLGKWINDVRMAFVSKDIPMQLLISDEPHQEWSDDSNCGVYVVALLFLVGSGKKFKDGFSKRVGKAEITRIRDLLYTPKNDYVPKPLSV